MKTHPFVRAYMAGIAVPTCMLIIILTVYAYNRFYLRPSYLAQFLRLRGRGLRALRRFDSPVFAQHERRERALMAKAVTC